MVERQLMFLEVTNISFTLLSRTSTHGCSQLKYQKSTVGDYTEEVLEWDCPRASANSRCEVSWCSFIHAWYHSGMRTDFPSFCSARPLQYSEERCEQDYRQVFWGRMSWCLKCIRTIAAVYVSFWFTTQEFSIVGGYTEHLKNHRTVKIGGGGRAFARTIRY